MAEVQAAERPLPHEEEDEAVLPDETADPLAEGKQKLTQATEEKLEGNRLFQKGENKEAIKIWRHALKLCYELSVSGTAPSQRELYDLEGALHLNLAAGLLKEKSFARSIEHCERVLQNDPTNEKAFLRMAKAHLELQEYKRAEEVTHQLLSCRPDSSAAKSLLKEIGREESVHRREEKSLYKSMFMSSSKASKQPEGHQHDAISCNKLEAMPMKGTSSQQEEKEGGKPSMTEEQRHSSSSFSSRRVIPPTKGENKICETSLGDEAVKDHTKSKSSLVKEIEKEASPSTLSSSSSLGGSLETSPAKSAPARSADSKDTKGKEEERIDMPRTSPKNEKEDEEQPRHDNEEEDDWIWPVEFHPDDCDPVVWQQPHSMESLQEDCNFPLTRSLPLTILYALQCVDETRRRAIECLRRRRRMRGDGKDKGGGEQQESQESERQKRDENKDFSVDRQSETPNGTETSTSVAASGSSVTREEKVESVEKNTTEKPMCGEEKTNEKVASFSKEQGNLQNQKWQYKSLRKDILCVHIIGATSAHEMGCKYTVLMERWPQVKTLILVFIGFLGNHGRLENELPHKQLCPPAVVRTQDGREQLAVPFKGTYQEFVEAIPGVLSNPKCTFFPDFAVLSTPLFARSLETWKGALSLLFDAKVLCIATVTGEMREDIYKELREEEEIVRHLGGHVVVSTSKNRFPILLRLPRRALTEGEANPLLTDFNASMAGRGSHETREDLEDVKHPSASSSGTKATAQNPEILGAKHAAFFVFRGRNDTPL